MRETLPPTSTRDGLERVEPADRGHRRYASPFWAWKPEASRFVSSRDRPAGVGAFRTDVAMWRRTWAAGHPRLAEKNRVDRQRTTAPEPIPEDAAGHPPAWTARRARSVQPPTTPRWNRSVRCCGRDVLNRPPLCRATSCGSPSSSGPNAPNHRRRAQAALGR